MIKIVHTYLIINVHSYLDTNNGSTVDRDQDNSAHDA